MAGIEDRDSGGKLNKAISKVSYLCKFIKIFDLDPDTIKALRLTCKDTKNAANAKVKKFTIAENQDPKAVQRSGLLENIKVLIVDFNICKLPLYARQSLGLLHLAVENCSKSLEILVVNLSCSRILGTATWKSLKQLKLEKPTPGLLPSFLANPGTLPALETLACYDPTALDLESLHKSSFLSNLPGLDLCLTNWGRSPLQPSQLVAKVEAMRSLLQKATNLKVLKLESTKFEFFDSEHLASLQSLLLSTPHLGASSVSLTPALARPWLKLQSLCIRGRGTSSQGPDLMRIFEAEDTLPVLKSLTIDCVKVTVAALSCVRRPYLEEFHLTGCRNGHELISKLAQLMKEDRNALPRLKKFQLDCTYECLRASAREAVSKFLSCPQMATLESLSITSLGLLEAEILTSDIEKYCPNLKHLELS